MTELFGLGHNRDTAKSFLKNLFHWSLCASIVRHATRNVYADLNVNSVNRLPGNWAQEESLLTLLKELACVSKASRRGTPKASKGMQLRKVTMTFFRGRKACRPGDSLSSVNTGNWYSSTLEWSEKCQGLLTQSCRACVSPRVFKWWINCVCSLKAISLLIAGCNMMQPRTGSPVLRLIRRLPVDRYSDSLATELDWSLSLFMLPEPSLRSRYVSQSSTQKNLWGGVPLCA